MTCLTKRTALAVLAAIALAVSSAAAHAADWPSKPVRILVPYGAGGAGDVMARVVAEALGAELGQQFVVENRTGGGGVVATQAAARAEPDGYTLMMAGMSSHVLTPAMQGNVGFDPMRDFTHMAFVGGAPSSIVVHPSLGVKSFAELLALTQANPGGIEYVSAGIGTVGNVLMEAVAAKAKFKVVHVPYRSGNAATVDLLAGRVKLGSLNWSTARQYVEAGKLVALAVSSARRLASAPDLPTLPDFGYPELVTTTWWALSGPAGVPKEIVEKANRATNKALTRADVRKHLEANAIETEAMSPAEVTRFFQAEIDKWVPLVRTLIKPQPN